jgi:hypothetical protein
LACSRRIAFEAISQVGSRSARRHRRRTSAPGVVLSYGLVCNRVAPFWASGAFLSACLAQAVPRLPSPASCEAG